MNYSDSIKAILLATINELAAQPEKYAVKPGVDFIQTPRGILPVYSNSCITVHKLLYQNQIKIC